VIPRWKAPGPFRRLDLDGAPGGSSQDPTGKVLASLTVIQDVFKEDGSKLGTLNTHEKNLGLRCFEKKTLDLDLMVFNICLKPQKIGRLKQQTWAVPSHKRRQLEPTQMGTLTSQCVMCVSIFDFEICHVQENKIWLFTSY